jgi:Na+-transporting NADH:ubiquinone oxidoreductase subunit C
VVKWITQHGSPSGKVVKEVFKGTAPKDNPYAVDGLSGATITSRGVTNLIRYWASDDGYGIYLDKLKQELTSEPKTSGEK